MRRNIILVRRDLRELLKGSEQKRSTMSITLYGAPSHCWVKNGLSGTNVEGNSMARTL